MKLAATGLAAITFAISLAARGASPTTAPAPIAISIGEPGLEISKDFVGLSFETKRTLAQPYLPATPGSPPTTMPIPPRLFSADDKPLVAFFKTLGIRSLRIGGNTADRATVPLPTHDDIDAVFKFARAADVKVIYTLRLRETAPDQIVETAKYIFDHYAQQLSHFAIGNEPDAYFKTYDDYRTHLEAAMKAVRAVAPGVAFCGPCTTQAHPDWSAKLARDFSRERDGFDQIAQHFYPCSDGKKATDRDAAIGALLSPKRVADYEKLRDTCLPAVREHGLRFRLEETNNFYNGGAPNASNTLASALWALDFMHWWAANGAGGFNFHTSDFFPLTPDDKATWYVAFSAAKDRSGYTAKPIAYAMAAFTAAAPARSIGVSIANPDAINVTAYATAAADGRLSLTVINKTFGEAARPVAVKLPTDFKATRRLVLTGADVAATEVTLGGKQIDTAGAWEGGFKTIHDDSAVVVPPASAVVFGVERIRG